MSFDPHSVERLRQLGRQLPQALPKPNEQSNKRPNKTSKSHRIETEENPHDLFRELIKVSKDGTVPPHLIERLKAIETKQLSHEKEDDKQFQASSNGKSNQTSTSKNSTKGKQRLHPKQLHNEEMTNKNLYASFERLLLDDEEEIA